MVELLVVIGIIVILASMLLPVMSKARSRAKYARWQGFSRDFRHDDAVIAQYTFEDDGGERLGNAAPWRYRKETQGTIVGAEWSTEGRFSGKGALYFDGAGDRVELGSWDVQTVARQPVHEMSILAWFKPESFATDDARLISKSTSDANADHLWMLSTRDAGGEMRIRSRLRTAGTTSEVLAGSGALETDAWYFAAMVYTGSEIRMYLNGELVGTEAKAGKVDVDNTVPVWIGGNPDGSKYFTGWMDEVTVVADKLKENQIRDVWRMGQP